MGAMRCDDTDDLAGEGCHDIETLALGVTAVGGLFDFDALGTGVAFGDRRRERVVRRFCRS